MNRVISILLTSVAVTVVAFSGRASGNDSDDENRSWTVLVKNENRQDEAKRALEQERHDEIKLLLEIVDAPGDGAAEAFDVGSTRNTAILLLGKMRAAEAVPSLIKLLLFPDEEFSSDALDYLLLVPAGWALAQIGMPAVEPLLSEIGKEGNSNHGKECTKTFVYILGGDVAQFKLEKAIAAEKNPKRKNNLKESLSFLRSDRFPDTFCKGRWSKSR